MQQSGLSCKMRKVQNYWLLLSAFLLNSTEGGGVPSRIDVFSIQKHVENQKKGRGKGVEQNIGSLLRVKTLVSASSTKVQLLNWASVFYKCVN